MIAAGDTIDEALQRAAEALEFAAEDWRQHTGRAFPPAHTIDELRANAAFRNDAADAIIAAVPLRSKAQAAE